MNLVTITILFTVLTPLENKSMPGRILDPKTLGREKKSPKINTFTPEPFFSLITEKPRSWEILQPKVLVSCQLSNDGVCEPQQICPDVKPVETPNLGVSTISGGQCPVNDQMLDEDVTA